MTAKNKPITFILFEFSLVFLALHNGIDHNKMIDPITHYIFPRKIYMPTRHSTLYHVQTITFALLKRLNAFKKSPNSRQESDSYYPDPMHISCRGPGNSTGFHRENHLVIW